jgi:hypothetical protein
MKTKEPKQNGKTKSSNPAARSRSSSQSNSDCGTGQPGTSYARILRSNQRPNKQTPETPHATGDCTNPPQTSAVPATARTKIPAITLDSTMESMSFIKNYKATCNPNMIECKLVNNSKIIVKVSTLEDYRSLLSLAAKSN